jgi:hypothetical protein
MKRYLQKVVLFLTPLAFIVIIGIITPTTPRASTSLLMAAIKKKSLLQNASIPRIILVGGSNLSFGINSFAIKDSLDLNPINTSIHASIGIKYMIDNVRNFIQKGDIVILVPEYTQYYRSLNFGSEELMRTIFDVDIKNVKYINVPQFVNLLSYLPKYSITKFNINEYRNINENEIYSVNSFNLYGDVYTHWAMDKKKFAPWAAIKGEFNSDVIKYFEEFNTEIKKKGAILLVSFPCIQEATYNNSVTQIIKVEQELKRANLHIIGSALRYKMHDSLLYNTPYHLNKNGVNYRTLLIIEDIKKALKNGSIIK